MLEVFNRRGTQLKVSLNPTTAYQILWGHFVDSVNILFDYVLDYVGDTDMVGITIHN